MGVDKHLCAETVQFGHTLSYVRSRWSPRKIQGPHANAASHPEQRDIRITSVSGLSRNRRLLDSAKRSAKSDYENSKSERPDGCSAVPKDCDEHGSRGKRCSGVSGTRAPRLLRPTRPIVDRSPRARRASKRRAITIGADAKPSTFGVSTFSAPSEPFGVLARTHERRDQKEEVKEPSDVDQRVPSPLAES